MRPELFGALLRSGAINSEKSILGRYKSELLNSWNDLVHAMESQNLHVAETASALVQTIRYVMFVISLLDVCAITLKVCIATVQLNAKNSSAL